MPRQRRLFSGNSSPAIYQRMFPWLACDRIKVALLFRNETASEREVLGFSAPLNVITRPQMLRSVPRRRPVNFLDNPANCHGNIRAVLPKDCQVH